jgi:hypothetical protein
LTPEKVKFRPERSDRLRIEMVETGEIPSAVKSRLAAGSVSNKKEFRVPGTPYAILGSKNDAPL